MTTPEAPINKLPEVPFGDDVLTGTPGIPNDTVCVPSTGPGGEIDNSTFGPPPPKGVGTIIKDLNKGGLTPETENANPVVEGDTSGILDIKNLAGFVANVSLPYGADIFQGMDPAHEAAMLDCAAVVQSDPSRTDNNDEFSYPNRWG